MLFFFNFILFLYFYRHRFELIKECKIHICIFIYIYIIFPVRMQIKKLSRFRRTNERKNYEPTNEQYSKI